MSSNIIGPLPKESVAPSDKVEKSSGDLDGIETPVVNIRRKGLGNKKEKYNTSKYHFQGKYARSKHWFDLEHECLEGKSFTREPYFYNIYIYNEY